MNLPTEPLYAERIDLAKNRRRGMKSYRYGAGYVYLMKEVGGDLYKIGISINPQKRLYDINNTMPFDVELVHTMPVREMKKCEDSWHYIFREKHVKGEWFRLNSNDVKLFKQCTGEHEEPLNIQIYWRNEWYWEKLKAAKNNVTT